jgi:hypothetical protein
MKKEKTKKEKGSKVIQIMEKEGNEENGTKS